MLQALEQTAPLPASQLPEEARGFYSVQNPDWPPLPGDLLGLNVWPLGNGLFALDDRDVDYAAIQAAAEEEAAQATLLKKKSPGGGMTPMFSLISSPGDTPVYLTNLTASLADDGSTTATFSIAGGTNGFAYDIYNTTNLTNSPVYSQWNWLGQGYTSNNYTFSNQPAELAFYTLAIPSQTMVVAWGDDSKGECDVPAELTNAMDVAAGYNKFNLALKADGTVVAWGDDAHGECTVPVGLTNVTAIAAGAYHAIVLKMDGTMVQWGDYSPDDNHYYPVGSAPGSNLVAIAAGSGHDLGLKADGTMVTWGFSNDVANYIPANLAGVKAIACGLEHNVALLTNGTVAVWGMNGAGYGWDITNIPAGLTNVTAIAAGAYHTLALKADGSVAAWGAGGTNTGIQTYENFGQSIVPAGLSNVVAIAGGDVFSLALKADGTVVVWGDNTFGQKNLPDGLAGVKAIAGGGFHGLALASGQLLPLILQEPVNQYALPGDTVMFLSKAQGFASVQYQWQFDGVNIAGATNASLTLTNVQSGNVGSYQVIISDAVGAVTSDTAVFAFLQPPQILSTTLPLGTNWITNGTPNTTVQIPLAVTATDEDPLNHPLSYQWRFNGTINTNAVGPVFLLSVYDYWSYAAPLEGNYTLTVSNAAGSTNLTWNIRVLLAGMVAAWGNDTNGECDRPVTLTNAMALAAGLYCSAAVRDDGTIVQWGDFAPDDFQTPAAPTPVGSPPANSNLVAVAAGIAHAVALKADGTVIQWGLAGANGLKNFPTNLIGVKAVSAGYERSLALLTNGSIVDWGYFAPIFNLNQRVPSDLTNVTAISCGAYHNLALRSDGTVASWGYNTLFGETNVPVGLSNAVAVAGGGRHSLALKADGTVVAWGDDTYGQCDVPAGLSNVLAIAAGDLHSVALKNDGTIISWGYNSDGQTNVPNMLSQIRLIAAGGDHTLAAMFSTTVQYSVDVTKDLLLVYNTNSIGSTTVEKYYLHNRPMVNGANVLGIGCPTNEIIGSVDFSNQVLAPYLNWLNQNPTKHPKYLVLFMDIPSRVEDVGIATYASVQYQLSTDTIGIQPFVTSINMNSVNGTNDCIAYINKLAYIGTNYSPGKLIISASAGGYGNTNYYFDDTEVNYPNEPVGLAAAQTLIHEGVSSNSVIYTNAYQDCGSLACHVTTGASVAGYFCWGFHSSLGSQYAINGEVQWTSNSGWWLIKTIESFNGQRAGGGGNFLMWFSSNAFGGTNYSNTPVGAISNVEEPGGVDNGDSIFLGLWVAGKDFGICAWNAVNSKYFQAIGDPLTAK